MALVLADPEACTTHLVEHPVPGANDVLQILNVCGDVDAVFITCGLNDRQKIALIRQGVNTIGRLRLLGRTRKTIQEMVKPLSTLAVNRGGTEFGLNIVTHLTALVQFFVDRRRLSLPLDPASFTNVVRDDYVSKVLDEDDQSSDSDDDEVEGPGKFKVDDFPTWKEGLSIKLRSMRSEAGVPLYYVIRSTMPANHDFRGDTDEERIHQVRQTGHEWNKDNKRVAQYILSLVQPTDGYEWIRNLPKSNGRAIYSALTAHYEGEHAATIITQANQTIQNLAYTNQQTFSWEIFSTRIKRAYDRLEENQVVIPIHEKLRVVKTKINTRNIEFNMLAKTALSYDPGFPNRSLTEYMSRVAEHVAAEFPVTQQGHGQRHRASVSQVESEPPRIETIDGKSFCNGVDITDKIRSYTSEEWKLLPRQIKREVMNSNRRGRGRGRGGAGRGSGGQSVASVNTEEGIQQIIHQTAQATIASLNTRDDDSTITTPTSVTFDGDPSGSKRPSSAVPTGALKRTKPSLSPVKMSNPKKMETASLMQSISLVRTRTNESPTYTVGYLEEDSHADMHCAGQNCVMLSTSGYTCDVSPFHEGYDARKDVEIVRSATAYQHEDGQITYIVMNISLWFGEELPHTLFNGLIARDAGNKLCTDPYDEKGLGFDLQRVSNGRDLKIPMDRRENKIGVKTFKPSRDDVLLAIDANSPNIIYLNPEDNYPPIVNRQAISEIISEISLEEDYQCHESNDNDSAPDLRPLKTELPLDTEEYYRYAVAPSDEAPFFWSHQIYNVASSLVRDVRRSIATTAQRMQYGPPNTQECSYPGICSIGTKSPHHGIATPEILQELWGIGHETARKTIEVTTQHAIRHAKMPLRRRYRTDLLSLNYRRIKETMHTDTVHSKHKSVLNNTCAQIYATESGATFAYPMTSKRLAGETLSSLCQDVGIPSRIFSDNAKEFVKPGTEFQKVANYYKIETSSIEPHTPKQNKIAEGSIGHMRKRWLHVQQTTGAHPRLWDFGLRWICEIMTLTYRVKYGRTGSEVLTGDTPDISNHADFTFYSPVWFWKSPSAQEPPQPGRWLGVANNIGTGTLCYWVMDKKGDIFSRTSVQNVTRDELKVDATKKIFEDLNVSINARLDGDNHFTEIDYEMGFQYIEDAEDDVPEPAEEAYIPEVDDTEQSDGYDEYIGAQLMFELGGESGVRGTVVKRSKGNDGKVIGNRNNNPLLDTRRYTVHLHDGSEREFSANMIAENLYSQVNEHGHHEMMFTEITGHRYTADHYAAAETMPTKHGRNWKMPKTTKGVQCRVAFKDGTECWLPMNEVRQSNPIELAEYAVQRGIADDPPFAWWVPHTLRTRRRMISKIKSKYWRTTHKFGIKVPKSVDDAYRIDKENNNDFWHRAIEKEMKRIREAMQEFDGDRNDVKTKLIGYQEIRCHMVFDVKMEGLTRKARFVAGGHTTETPKSLTYASVVSRESVRIGFLIAALNDLNIMAADIGNAYLNADCREKIYFIAGKEFGSKAGCILIIKKALYGLKSSGAAWRSLFSATLVDLQYEPCRGDPDVYIRKAVKPDGTKYYEMLFVYVDDILHISHHKTIYENDTMKAIGELYKIKDDSLKPPEVYLGANVGLIVDETGTKMSYMSATDYIGGALKTVEADLPDDMKLNGQAKRPFPETYKPELDATPFADEDGIQKYQGYIGVLRWVVELGRIDIHVEVSQLASYLVAPRQGHMQAALYIFAYLRKHKDQIMLFNPHNWDCNESAFRPTDWKDIYGDIQEEIPPNLPEPLGLPVRITAYVDADHAGNKVTRRSQTGYIIFVQSAPVIWFSKKQNTIEASTFGAELVALRLVAESLIALRHKLRSFGVRIDGPTDLYCDNRSVVDSVSRAEGRLNKKHLAICYHRVRECCAMSICRIAHVKSEYNLADILTKVLSYTSRTSLIQCILRHFRHHPSLPETN